MAGTLNGEFCDFARGYVAGPRQSTYVWSVPGIPGQGRQRLGTQPVVSKIVLVRFGSEPIVRTWYGVIESIQVVGDPVVLVNDQGESFNVFVESVSQLELSGAAGAGGTRGQVEITVTGAD